jgi:hypothetical protein
MFMSPIETADAKPAGLFQPYPADLAALWTAPGDRRAGPATMTLPTAGGLARLAGAGLFVGGATLLAWMATALAVALLWADRYPRF